MTDKSRSGALREEPSLIGEIGEIAKTILYALAITLVLRVIVFQPFTIPSASMVPTLLEGDYIIVSKFSYGWSRHSIPFSPPIFEGRIFERAPQRGDIIVFKLPSDGRTDYIKRLIGLPGDRIQMRDDVLYINEQAVPRTALAPVEADLGYPRTVERYVETLPGGRSFTTYDFGPNEDLDDTPVFTVPAGEYFFMGDDRDFSSDSRVAPQDGGVGFVPAENLVGKAQVILLSWDKGASLFKPWTWFSKARVDRFFRRLS